MRVPGAGVVMVVALLAAGCAEHLPDQDLRILTTAPSAKLSPADLWGDFQKDAAAARRQYFGRAVDVTGAVTAMEVDPAKQPHLFFAQADGKGVRARLLDEQAAETTKDLKVGDRMTLRCFCEDLDEAGDLILRSCIRK